MSPLLCQLSYTATSEVACGKPILPEEGSDCLRSSRWKLTIQEINDPSFRPLTTALAASVGGRESVFGEGAS